MSCLWRGLWTAPCRKAPPRKSRNLHFSNAAKDLKSYSWSFVRLLEEESAFPALRPHTHAGSASEELSDENLARVGCRLGCWLVPCSFNLCAAPEVETYRTRCKICQDQNGRPCAQRDHRSPCSPAKSASRSDGKSIPQT